MVDRASTSVVFRPMRSPKWPNNADPMGLAMNAMAKVANDCSVAAVASPAGKNSSGKTITAAVA